MPDRLVESNGRAGSTRVSDPGAALLEPPFDGRQCGPKPSDYADCAQVPDNAKNLNLLPGLSDEFELKYESAGT